jgi:MFS family permease
VFEDHEYKNTGWLLRKNPVILNLFTAIFTLGLMGGLLRFLFPFQILDLGGSEALISWGSAFSSMGQIVGLLGVSRLVRERRSTLLAAGGLLSLFALIVGITPDGTVLAVARITEGMGSGLLLILIIRVSTEFGPSRGESVGTLLAAMFLGSAIGQGLAGWTVEYLVLLIVASQVRVIMLVGAAMSVLSAAVLVISVARGVGGVAEHTALPKHTHGHTHLGAVAKIVSSRRVLLLACVYLIYDFSHGIYTPGLSILFEGNGIPMEQIGLGYLVGDIVWGIVQVYAGRYVDRVGHLGPLLMSLIVKGATVILYPGASSFPLLTSLLIVAGVSEGFLEPSRNDAAMSFAGTTELVHDHPHHYLARAQGLSFSLASHRHEHVHTTGSNEIVSFLQTIGIAGFAMGSTAGAWLLLQGFFLADLVIVGGVLLVCTGLLSVGLHQRTSTS